MYQFGMKGLTLTSPKAECKWAKVVEPDTKFNADGIFSINLTMNDALVPMVAQLEKLLDEAFAKFAKDNPAKAKQYTKATIVRTEIKEDGSEGDAYLHFKTQAKDKFGKQKTITQYDVTGAKKEPTLIGNGSTVKVGFTAMPYEMASSKTIGLSLYLSAVQVISLVEFGGSFDFADESDELPTWAEAS